MVLLCAGVAAICAVVLGSAIGNVALHWRRARPRHSGARKLPPLLPARGLIDEAAATLLAWLGPIAALLPAPAARTARDTADLAVLRDRRLPANAHWLLVRRLRRAGWRVTSGLPTGAPVDTGAVAHLGRRITARVGGDRPITLIAIGSSGLLARKLAAGDARFTRVVTVATPHQGSFAPVQPRACRPQSLYLETVANTDTRPRPYDAVAIYSDADAWLEPTAAAYCPGAFNLEVHGVGHVAMLFSRRVFTYIEENIASPLPADLTR